MPQQKEISEILRLAKISQYLAANDSAEKKVLNSADLDPLLALKIYMERKAVQWVFDKAPTDETLRGTANYLYALLGKYARLSEDITEVLEQPLPIVTGPSDANVTAGSQASFTIGVTSAIPYTIAWFRNGVPIVGATGLTYSFVALIGDNGAVFNAVATSAAGSAPSGNASLTVVGALQGQYYFGDSDFYANLLAGTDAVPYSGIFNITDGQPLSILLPLAAANNKYHVYKYPAAQGPKNDWSNTPTNFGQIPDQAFREILTIGSNLYIVSRQAISIDTNLPMIFT